MVSTPLLPLPPQWCIASIVAHEATVHIGISVDAKTASCPVCHTSAERIHSHYTRTLADVPAGGQRVVLQVTVRKFFCPNHQCTRKLFTEQYPAFALPYARMTNRLIRALQTVGLVAGGEPGSRLAHRLGMPTSPSTLLHALMHLPVPPPSAVRVVGIDEWAWKKGRRYGTILVDLEHRQVVDILPDDTVATISQWLVQHPGIEVIARDRANTIADAARQGAPTALQVADRFHLLVNLRSAIQRLLERHRACLPTESQIADNHVEEAQDLQTRDALHQQAYADEPAPPRKADVIRGRAKRAIRLARFEQVRAFAHQGLSIRAIARTLGLARQTVQTYVQADTFPERASGKKVVRGSILDPFVPYLLRRWQEGCYNGMQLYREIAEQGYAGSAQLVGFLVADLRRVLPPGVDLPQPSDQPIHPRARPIKGAHAIRRIPGYVRLSAREATWLFLTASEKLTPRQQRQLAFLQQAHPDLQAASGLAHTFVNLVTTRHADGLPRWLEAATQSRIAELQELARGIRRDEAAVHSALALPWSTGPVEGQITRLKMLKRTMFGRAGYPLLRQRVLLQP